MTTGRILPISGFIFFSPHKMGAGTLIGIVKVSVLR